MTPLAIGYLLQALQLAPQLMGVFSWRQCQLEARDLRVELDSEPWDGFSGDAEPQRPWFEAEGEGSVAPGDRSGGGAELDILEWALG